MPTFSVIRAIVRSIYAVTRVAVRGRTCLRREGDDLWSFAARAVRESPKPLFPT